MNLRWVLSGLCVVGGIGFAQTVSVPSLSVTAVNSGGASFTYSGTLTQAATIGFTASGDACLQAGGIYCTNAAGVVVVAGSSPVGAATTFSGTFGGTTQSWTFGSLIMIISGVGAVQVFPASAGNGLGSGSPSTSLTVSTASLSTLGFGSFSVSNPTITFVVADNNYGDNSAGFSVSQGGGSQAVTPAPATLYLALVGVVALAFLFRRKLGIATR